MTTFGWIVISVLSLMTLYLLFNLVSEVLLNKKLIKFKQKIEHQTYKVSHMIIFKKAYQVALSVIVVFTLAISGVFNNHIITEHQRTMTLAHQVGSKEKLLSIIEQDDSSNRYFFGPEVDVAFESAPDDQDRGFIDTNTQVDGVNEADIIKTDGQYIYYASKYQQSINVVLVNESYEVEILDRIDLKDVYTENIYLLEDYIIVVGYTYDTMPYQYIEGSFWLDWIYRAPTGTILIIDRSEHEIIYELETDTYFFDHRVIGDMMYLVSTKHLYIDDDELRPTFKESINDTTFKTFVDYDDIYYYDDMISSTLTVITSVDLNAFSYQTQAFVGHVNHIYVDENSMYTAYNYYDYQTELSQSTYYSTIVKFDIEHEDKTITYKGGKTLYGHIQNAYWMDEHNDYLRVVTSQSWPAKNRLYVLQEDIYEDKLNIVSSIANGLGLEGETVRSVRFHQTYAQVVTFLQTDPLYTIDLTDPYQPFILDDPILEEGFSTYMHMWNSDYHLIGFGFDATSDGRVTGLKLSAYDKRLAEPLETYSFASDDSNGFSYSFSEATYNPKALMIDPNRGIVGFPMSMYKNTSSEHYYESSFVIFFIDFNSDQIISNPIFIRHDQTEYYTQVERGIYIENIFNGLVTDRYIYTFSNEQIVVFHIESDMIIQKEYLI